MANWSDTYINLTTKDEYLTEFLYTLFTNIQNGMSSGNKGFDNKNTFAISSITKHSSTSLIVYGESRWELNLDTYKVLLDVFAESYEIIDMEAGNDFFIRTTQENITTGMYNGIEHYQSDPDYVRLNLLDYVSKVHKGEEERIDDHDNTILELMEKHNEFTEDRLVEIHIQALKEKLT